MRPLSSYLQNIEFADILFHYQLESPRILPRFSELPLRSTLVKVGMERLDPLPFERLFSPSLPHDPTAIKRYQRPAPPFAFQPIIQPFGTDLGIISCRLFGDGIASLDDLIHTMEGIDPFSCHRHQEKSHLVAVSATDASGQSLPLWERGSKSLAAPPRITAAWRLDTLALSTEWTLEIITPARLIVHKKPLFRPELRHLLPFILRRVTSVCYFYNHFEIQSAQELLKLGEEVKKAEGKLEWCDWRTFEKEEGFHETGGVMGKISLSGQFSDDFIHLLALGALMNIGKGAAYGCGALRLSPNYPK